VGSEPKYAIVLALYTVISVEGVKPSEPEKKECIRDVQKCVAPKVYIIK
jgi:hypothetical protein